MITLFWANNRERWRGSAPDHVKFDRAWRLCVLLDYAHLIVVAYLILSVFLSLIVCYIPSLKRVSLFCALANVLVVMGSQVAVGGCPIVVLQRNIMAQVTPCIAPMTPWVSPFYYRLTGRQLSMRGALIFWGSLTTIALICSVLVALLS